MSLTIAELNAADQATFTAALGHLFEHAPWIAEETWEHRPFRDAAHLHAELVATMRMASRGRQKTLIEAHPDLAGRAAQQRQLTPDSSREQASAGLLRLTDAELAEFQEANAAYRERFGFPFIICARLNAKDHILHAMRTRYRHSPAEEWTTALSEIEKIARLRLDDLMRT